MNKKWMNAGVADNIPSGGGGCALVNGEQIAIFTNNSRDQWYATQNHCPHENIMVLSRGIVGCADNKLKVSCPLHKNSFSLETGQHLGGNEEYRIKTYPIRVVDGVIEIQIESKHAHIK